MLNSPRARGLFLIAAGLALGCLPAAAHEYWVAPDHFTVAAGERVAARLFVGQMMRGTELPWLSHQVSSFRVVTPSGSEPLRGLDGDMPAVAYTAEEPGLHVIAHETVPLPITFDSMQQFADYLEYEGLGAVLERHRARGLPESGFTEHYARAAKALVQVGPVRAGDRGRAVGLPFELVALGNPYAAPDKLRVRLTWMGQPEADTQIAVFRDDGTVTRSLVQTGADGVAEVPISEPGRYLLSAVHMEPAVGGEHVWESTWASLSFGVGAAR